MEINSLINLAMTAIKEGDLKRLKNIAGSIPEDIVSEVFSGADKNGETFLIQAIDGRDVSIVKFLLEECHVDPMIIDRRGAYSLNVAIINGQLEVIKMLIESGAMLNAPNNVFYTCSSLSLACVMSVKIARYMLEICEDIDKSKCLIENFRYLDVGFMKHILDCGADINFKDERGQSVIHLACQSGRIEILKLLDKKGVDHTAIYEGLTSLQIAALNCNQNIISFYAQKNYCTREELWDCYELQGVGSVGKHDFDSAIKFWNKVLDERPQHEKNVFKSSFLAGFQNNSQHIENYDHLIEDGENAAIHSFLILERIFGIENLPGIDCIRGLLILIPIENIEFWEAIVRLISEHSRYTIFYAFHSYFTFKFRIYIQSLQFETINSSILKIFYEFVNGSLRKEFLKSEENEWPAHHSIRVLSLLCLYSIKENVKDFNEPWFYSVIKAFSNPKTCAIESLFHTLLTEGTTWEFPDRVVYETLDLCCKLSESINYLNSANETPLHLVLNNNIEDIDEHSEETLNQWNTINNKFIDILLKYEPVKDTKNKYGETIRKAAVGFAREEDVCIGTNSLKTLVILKMRGIFENKKDCPVILKSYRQFH